MILKVYQNSVIDSESYTAFEEEITNTDIPLLNICHVVGMVTTFRRYYPGCFLQMMGDGELPYLLVDGKLEWNIPIERATVRDFLATHPQCLEEGIYVESGYAAAGGPGRIAVITAWNMFCLLLRSRGVELGFTVEAIGILIPAILEIKDYFAEKNVRPTQLVCRVVQLNVVVRIEIKKQLGMDVDEAEQLLTGFGYRQDEKSEKFISQENEKHKVWNLLRMLEEQEMDK